MSLESREMREVYTEQLMDLAEKDERIVLVEADLMRAAKSLTFQERFPERTVDVGVAEANMVGVAAGLSAFGKIPFTHSFTSFATRRCFDQITISVAYAGLNVKIMGSDPGVAAELNGGTHMSFEDVGIMRNIPDMVIFEPVDNEQLTQAMPYIVKHIGPVYIRLFRKKTEKIFDEGYTFNWCKADTLQEGSDATIIATGLMVKNALLAAKNLEAEGIRVRVLNIHTVKPIDQHAIIKAAEETGAIVTAENHNIINGLGSAVAEVLIENHPVPMKRIGVRDHFGEVGKMDFLMEKYQMTPEAIAEAVKDVLQMKHKYQQTRRHIS
ncbi:transketolase family protein [Vallitalea pronyensis]|uniref:Transketolase family protein n=1 Tax=Vallitalea pronyensis TaxID=1348613 RepID=A0A8J8SHK8_9FIRM|nr:transketolase family protein [Vallitalea pronyensis]QUI23681.1 transketolase family protein [Vallitalea pronyensis]